MWLLAIGAAVGGLDCLLGNRLKLGERFEEGFRLLGSTALSMAGILCLAPLLTKALSCTLAPVWKSVGLDPGMLGGILPVDMGGYQTALGLAQDRLAGRYAGILVSSTLGCTLGFTIPMGMGLLERKDTEAFSRGILIGLGPMPLALMAGGCVCGLPVGRVFFETLPVGLFSILLMLCIRFAPQKSLRLFAGFAKLIRFFSAAGLCLGAVQSIARIELVSGMAPLEEAMETTVSICIAMLGSLPAAEILRRILFRPFCRLGKRFGMDERSFAGLLIGFVSAVPALSMLSEMDERGKTMNAAFLVCGASAMAAHLGFTVAMDQSMLPALLITKTAGGLMGAGLALLLTGKQERKLSGKMS